MMKFIKIHIFGSALILVFSLMLSSCGSSDSTNINTEDPERAFSIAKKDYDKGDYLDAIDDFSYIKVKFSGSSISDKAQYYLGMSYYKREEFILAAYEFEYHIKNYATSPLMADSRYMLAMCYYGLSPKYDLDQTYTMYAIGEFKNFLELFPNDKNAPVAEARIKELRNKLAYKEFRSGVLYYKMDNYRASIIYYDHVLEDYFDTDYADDALYNKIRVLVERKKYEEARKEIDRFESRFPKSEFFNRVQNIKKSI